MSGAASRPLAPEFYARPVLEVAPELIGCTVAHGRLAGVIVETEAYHQCEPACHAFAGLTPRTRTLFGAPGRAYVYRSYGVHALLNAVCEADGIGAAVLIRALQPAAGIERMRARRGLIGDRPARDSELCSGPGKLTQALGIGLGDDGRSLSRGPLRILARAEAWQDPVIVEGERVGITRAVELRWRFCAGGNGHVSRPRPSGVSRGGHSPTAPRGRGRGTRSARAPRA
jgi:DNA-3-methyladenine glycosylase